MGWQGNTRRLARKTDYVLAEMALGQHIKIKGDHYFMRGKDQTRSVRRAIKHGLIEQLGGRGQFCMTPAGKERWRELRKD